MVLRAPFPDFRLYPLPAAPPLAIAAAPRPWLDRADGECAFPVAGDGWLTLACCNPCHGSNYCRVHRALMLRPRV